MEILNLLFINPILFFCIGIILYLISKNKKRTYFYSLIISSLLSYLLLRFQFLNNLDVYIYIPFYALISVLGTLVSNVTLHMIRTIKHR